MILETPNPTSSSAREAKNIFEGAYKIYEEKTRHAYPIASVVLIVLVACLLFFINYFKLYESNFFTFSGPLMLFGGPLIVVFIYNFVRKAEQRKIEQSPKWQKLYLESLIKECDLFEASAPTKIQLYEEVAKSWHVQLIEELEEVNVRREEAKQQLQQL